MTVHRPFASPLGGVMTAEPEGVISGDLVLRLRAEGDLVHAEVAYAETDDWYRVEGSPLAGPAGNLDDLAARVAAHLARTPPALADGNPGFTDVRDITLQGRLSSGPARLSPPNGRGPSAGKP